MKHGSNTDRKKIGGCCFWLGSISSFLIRVSSVFHLWLKISSFRPHTDSRHLFPGIQGRLRFPLRLFFPSAFFSWCLGVLVVLFLMRSQGYCNLLKGTDRLGSSRSFEGNHQDTKAPRKEEVEKKIERSILATDETRIEHG